MVPSRVILPRRIRRLCPLRARWVGHRRGFTSVAADVNQDVPWPEIRLVWPAVMYIPKLIVRPGTFRAHRVVICRETARTTENVIAGHNQ